MLPSNAAAHYAANAHSAQHLAAFALPGKPLFCFFFSHSTSLSCFLICLRIDVHCAQMCTLMKCSFAELSCTGSSACRGGDLCRSQGAWAPGCRWQQMQLGLQGERLRAAAAVPAAAPSAERPAMAVATQADWQQVPHAMVHRAHSLLEGAAQARVACACKER